MGLEYNNRNYVAHPSTKEVKVKFEKIATHDVLGGNHSSTKQINSSQQLIIFSLLLRSKIDIGEIIYNDLVTRLMDKSRQKYASYPRFISCSLQRLLGSDYPQDHKFRFIPPVISQTNFSKNPSEVTPIELTAFMNDLISHETLLFPLLASEKKGKKKTRTVTKPTCKLQGLEASRALPQKGKKSKAKKTTLIQTTLKLDQQKVPSEATNTSQSVSSGQSTNPQDIEGNIQPVVKGLPSTTDEDIHTSSLLSKAQPIDPNDSEGNIHPADKGLPATHPYEGIRTS
ncbi:hypothetical protein Tco_0184480 [Tanacetum coccineum]